MTTKQLAEQPRNLAQPNPDAAESASKEFGRLMSWGAALHKGNQVLFHGLPFRLRTWRDAGFEAHNKSLDEYPSACNRGKIVIQIDNALGWLSNPILTSAQADRDLPVVLQTIKQYVKVAADELRLVSNSFSSPEKLGDEDAFVQYCDLVSGHAKEALLFLGLALKILGGEIATAVSSTVDQTFTCRLEMKPLESIVLD